MVNLRTPGVKIKEISTLPPSVAPVDTAIPAFVGYTENVVSEPQRINSFLEFEQIFGGPSSINVTGASVSTSASLLTGQINLDTGTTSITIEGNAVTTSIMDTVVNDLTFASVYKLYYSIKSFFDNGGGTCYVVSAGKYDDVSEDIVDPVKLKAALETIKTLDEPTLLVVPDAISLGTVAEFKDVMDTTALTQAEELKDRFVIMDTFPTAGNPLAEITNFRDNAVGTSNLRYGAVYYPRLILNNVAVSIDDDSTVGTVTYSPGLSLDIVKDAVLIKEDTETAVTWENYFEGTPPITEEALLALVNAEAVVIASVDANVATFVKSSEVNTNLEVGPSGTVAGIYARVDFDRGVWKAPANVSITGATPQVRVDDALQSQMNVDPTAGKSVNAIRTFTGRGDLVWGARTLDGNSNEWRYVNVRRLFNFVEESVLKATTQFVFEPNTRQTWSRVKGLIDNFLVSQWRQGALAGAKPEDAFFVNVGLGTTMTSQDVLQGIMNVEIGLAPSRPAEFIVLKFSQKLQES